MHYTRLFKDSPLCEICSGEVDSIEHILSRCNWTKSVWSSFIFVEPLEVNSISSSLRWMSDLVESLDSGPDVLKFWGKVATSAWFIWVARNNFIFASIHINCAFVIVRISSALSDFQSVYGRVQDSALAPFHNASVGIPPSRWVVTLRF